MTISLVVLPSLLTVATVEPVLAAPCWREMVAPLRLGGVLV
jgi:hypothetical protein